MSAALRGRAARNGALIVLLLGLTVSGCASTGSGQAPPAGTSSRPVTQTVTVTASRPSPPTHTVTVPARPAASAPPRTTAPPAPPSTYVPPPPAPPPPPPAAPTTAAPAGNCSIRSNEGTCYKAGEFCRKADLGATTTDDAGRAIRCVQLAPGEQPHWEY